MANLVNLGCKCGGRGGDPSENSHYMIIHHFAYTANVKLRIVLLYAFEQNLGIPYMYAPEGVLAKVYSLVQGVSIVKVQI